MTSLRFKWALFAFTLILFGFYLLPTVRYYSLPPDNPVNSDSLTVLSNALQTATDPMKVARLTALRDSLLNSAASQRWRGSSDPNVTKLRENAMKLGLDLQGGAYLVYEVDLSKIPPKDRKGDEVDRAIEIIRNRVDQFGVTEPVIQKTGQNRIVIELPGADDPTRIKELVGKTARLDFRLVKTRQELFQALAKVDQTIERTGLKSASTDSAAVDTSAVDSLIAGKNPFSGLFQGSQSEAGVVYCPAENLDKATRMLKVIQPDAARPTLLPGGTILLWGDRAFGARTGNPGRYLYALTATTELTGDHIADAQVAFGLETARPNAAGISMTFDKRGSAIFTRLTGNNVGRQLAIVLDNTVKSAPVIRDKIRGGRASITGIDTDVEAKDLGIVLRAGALPTDVIPQEGRTVGATLGKDSIEKGVRASVVGFLAIALFMIFYYRLSGTFAVFALMLNVFYLLATLGMLRGTLTLPGIAGIALTIGMAVDTNVLILERIREELRGGKTVRGAIEAGYSRAFTTILDTHSTTLISAVVLFQFGTGPIKGFATTLMIGLVANLFCAVFVTRMIDDTLMARRPMEKMSI
jgi:protein-export membrane protein SecD